MKIRFPADTYDVMVFCGKVVLRRQRPADVIRLIGTERGVWQNVWRVLMPDAADTVNSA